MRRRRNSRNFSIGVLVELSREGLNAPELGQINPEHVQQMDSSDDPGEVQELGKALAKPKVKAEHFARIRGGELAWLLRK
jgi:hypothetical protein